MSFVGGFFSFSLSVANANSGYYGETKVRVCQHPLESTEFMVARVVALSHCTNGDATFSEGLYDPSQPTIQTISVTGERVLWSQVGVPQQKVLQQQLRHHKTCQSTLYLMQQTEVQQLAGYLKGSKSNWIETLPVYLIDPTLVESLVSTISSKNQWSVTITGEDVYVGVSSPKTSQESTHFGVVSEVYPWQEFQALHAV